MVQKRAGVKAHAAPIIAVANGLFKMSVNM
jgi:hypothetical protein